MKTTNKLLRIIAGGLICGSSILAIADPVNIDIKNEEKTIIITDHSEDMEVTLNTLSDQTATINPPEPSSHGWTPNSEVELGESSHQTYMHDAIEGETLPSDVFTTKLTGTTSTSGTGEAKGGTSEFTYTLLGDVLEIVVEDSHIGVGQPTKVNAFLYQDGSEGYTETAAPISDWEIKIPPSPSGGLLSLAGNDEPLASSDYPISEIEFKSYYKGIYYILGTVVGASEPGRVPGVVEVHDVEIIPDNGTEIEDNDNNEKSRLFIVAPDPNDVVTINAILDSVLLEDDLPEGWTINGGNGAGKLNRTIDVSTLGEEIFTFDFNGTDPDYVTKILKITHKIKSLSPSSDLELGDNLEVEYDLNLPLGFTYDDIKLQIINSNDIVVYELTGLDKVTGTYTATWNGAKWNQEPNPGCYANPKNGPYKISLIGVKGDKEIKDVEEINTKFVIESTVEDPFSGNVKSGLSNLPSIIEMVVGSSTSGTWIEHKFENSDISKSVMSMGNVHEFKLEDDSLNNLDNGVWGIFILNVRDDIGNYYDDNHSSSGIQSYSKIINLR